jgi:tetratricopeptide (TPR) repeat protein
MIGGRHKRSLPQLEKKRRAILKTMRGALARALALTVVPTVLLAVVPPCLGGWAGAAKSAGDGGHSFWSRAAGVKAPTKNGEGQTAGWFVAAVERTNQGRYAEAAAAYGMALAAGADAPAVYANLGEVLMADGQLAAAEACYRDAVAVASVSPLPNLANVATLGSQRFDDPRARAQELVLAYLGLAVALDRDGQTRAARGMMQRALELDSTTAVLAVAELPNSDLFFVPAGDVYYYIGLARSVAGRRQEALGAFREFLARQPASRWAGQAKGHLTELAQAHAPSAPSAPPAPGHGRASGPRVVAVGTVLSTGGGVAPLIDAAWRDQAAILDDCLSSAPELAAARLPVRLTVELTLDGHGRVSAAAVELPPAARAWASAEKFSGCLQRAIKTRLRLPPQPAARRTRARTELLVGFPSP